MEITRANIRQLLLAESTNAARTFVRNDGVSDFEKIVIDSQADSALDGAWREACSKLLEKMHEFVTASSITNTALNLTFANEPGGAVDNVTMYIVDYMMADWLGSVRPDYRQRYVERCNFQLDDLLRKLYKKEPPV